MKEERKDHEKPGEAQEAEGRKLKDENIMALAQSKMYRNTWEDTLLYSSSAFRYQNMSLCVTKYGYINTSVLKI